MKLSDFLAWGVILLALAGLFYIITSMGPKDCWTYEEQVLYSRCTGESRRIQP